MYGLYDFKSGLSISCSIRGTDIRDAKIHLDEYPYENGSTRAWICHNHVDYDGDRSPNKHGYKYSWTFTLDRDGSSSDDVANVMPIIPGIELKSNISIDPELIHFFRVNDIRYSNIFSYKVGIFDEYYKYEISNNDGFIVLKNDKKTMEIKLSRFIRQIVVKFNDIKSVINKLPITDKIVESIHNKFVAYQKNSSMVHFLKGDDILKGYTRENYLDSDGGTLHNSCMSDKLYLLDLYTKNTNQVELAVVYQGDKISARTLVWTATDGKRYHDRVYYRHDWMENLVSSKLNKMGISNIKDSGIKCVKLEKWEFDKYPYLDNFYHFDKENGALFSINTNKFNTLRNTNGTMD